MFKEFVKDWMWQLPQNLIGVLYKYLIKDRIVDMIPVTKEGNQLIFKETKGSVSLGKYIFVYRNTKNISYIVNHETGHTKQSLMLGPLYLIVIGFPSFLWALLHKNICSNVDYYKFYTEAWANKLMGI